MDTWDLPDIYAHTLCGESKETSQYIRHIAPETCLEYSTVRCKNFIVNNETRWSIQVNSGKISLLTEAFCVGYRPESSYLRRRS